MGDRVGCIIFDIDGTLVAGMSVWIRCIRETLLHLGVDATDHQLIEEFRSFFRAEGPADSPWREILHQNCPEREEEAWTLLGQKLKREYARAKISPKTKSFLETVRQRGVKTGIVTFRTREDAQHLLVKMKADHLFDVIVGVSDVTEQKPSPQPYLKVCEELKTIPSECVVVGDEPADIIGGIRAGMRTIGVLSGVSDQAMLEASDAGSIIESLAQLPHHLTLG